MVNYKDKDNNIIIKYVVLDYDDEPDSHETKVNAPVLVSQDLQVIIPTLIYADIIVYNLMKQPLI